MAHPKEENKFFFYNNKTPKMVNSCVKVRVKVKKAMYKILLVCTLIKSSQ